MLSIGWGGYSLPLVSGGASGCQDCGEPEPDKIFSLPLRPVDMRKIFCITSRLYEYTEMIP
jgi:biotin synthase-related radical SAM superfamily protein